MQAASPNPPVPALDRKRLAAVLELIGSDQPGERQAAAEAAHRLIRAAGLRWGDVLDTPPPRPEPPRPASPGWRHLVATCRTRPELLTEWEAEFLATVARQRSVSRKQYGVLARLAGRAQS